MQISRIPVVNNIDVAICSQPDDIRSALVRQAAGPVRWVECMQAIAEQGIDGVVECGPGKVLAGMAKRILPDISAAALFDPASLQEVKGLFA
jgi:[acyl-carrier-protein] S-malonyltransferase